MIDMKTLRELENLLETGKDAMKAFTDACDVQAEKHELEASALKRYVRASLGDKLDKLAAENETMGQLGLAFGGNANEVRTAREALRAV